MLYQITGEAITVLTLIHFKLVIYSSIYIYNYTAV